MTVTVAPGPLSGTVEAIASKSCVHRLAICAALGAAAVSFPCRTVSADILATARCLSALGAEIDRTQTGFSVKPIPGGLSGEAELDCGESGSTYRFLAPVVCALGRTARFRLSGKLPERPMEALWTVLEAHGAKIEGKKTACPVVSGPVGPGDYRVQGDVSSQFISGLLFALPLLGGDSRIQVSGPMASAGYVRMTLNALETFSVQIHATEDGFAVPGAQKYIPPEACAPEGDWSNAAFWLCAGAAAGGGITVAGLTPDSGQGDKAVCEILQRLGAKVVWDGTSVTVKPGALRGIRIDADPIPDLVPALAVAAAAAEGETVFENVSRLRLKESDRVEAVCRTLGALGGVAYDRENELIVRGRGRLKGGAADSFGDHRIAMMASAASVLCENPVTIVGARAVDKSYPGFYQDFASLGGAVREDSL